MPKLNRFWKKLLPLLVTAALVPMACRDLVLVMIHADKADGSPQDSLNHSGSRTFGRMFLHQLNCQSLEFREKFSGDHGGSAAQPGMESLAFFPQTPRPLGAPYERRSFAPTTPIPLRI